MTMEVHDVTDTDHTHREINSLRTTTEQNSRVAKRWQKWENERIERLMKMAEDAGCSGMTENFSRLSEKLHLEKKSMFITRIYIIKNVGW